MVSTIVAAERKNARRPGWPDLVAAHIAREKQSTACNFFASDRPRDKLGRKLSGVVCVTTRLAREVVVLGMCSGAVGNAHSL